MKTQRTPNKLERREAGGAVLKAGEDRRVRFLASSAEVDRHGTIIVPGGIKTENFSRNPAFVWAHQTGGIFTSCQPEDVLGRVGEFEVTDKGLEIVAEFAEASVNPKAERCYRAVQAELLNAVSIGFVPIKWHVEERDGGEILIFDEVDLLEVSLVILGSNPEALALRSLFAPENDMKTKLALQKLNLAEGAKPSEVRAALLSYLASTDDDKATRAAVVRAAEDMAKSEGRAEGEDHEEPDGDEGEDREEGEDKPKPKDDEGEDREEGDEEDEEDEDEEKRALRQALAWTREGLVEARQSGKGAAAKERRIVEEVDGFIRSGQVPRHQREEALKLHRAGRLERTVKHIEPGTFTTSQRLRSGNVGTPVDAPPRREDRRSGKDAAVLEDAKKIIESANSALARNTRGL